MSEAQESTPVVESSDQSSGDSGSVEPSPEPNVEAAPQETATAENPA